MLKIYRRHLKSCEHRAEGRTYRRCHCPIWVDGFLAGQEMRESLGTRDWQKANEKILEWEAKNEITVEVAAPITVDAAWEKFLEDATARGLQADSLRKYRQLKRLMGDFAKLNGLLYLKQFDVEMTRAFRSTWTLRNLAAAKRLDYLRAFFRLTQDNGWIAENPAKKLKPPKTVNPPTLPFSRQEMKAILAACGSAEVRALVLLMRHSGLRIGDAVSLAADRIHDGKLMLRTAKTSTVVWCPLPPFVIAMLEAVKRPNGYFFWTGQSKRSSVADTWRKRLAPVFKAALVLGAHPHRFRDTFAVELLLAGVPLERVSILLGHASTRITEKHYAPWVPERQEQLEADVRRTWIEPEPETKGTPEVHGERRLVN